MPRVKLDLEHIDIKEKEIMKYKDKVERIHKEFHETEDKENCFLRLAKSPNRL